MAFEACSSLQGLSVYSDPYLSYISKNPTGKAHQGETIAHLCKYLSNSMWQNAFISTFVHFLVKIY